LWMDFRLNAIKVTYANNQHDEDEVWPNNTATI
jgi:hypothetical protein